MFDFQNFVSIGSNSFEYFIDELKPQNFMCNVLIVNKRCTSKLYDYNQGFTYKREQEELSASPVKSRALFGVSLLALEDFQNFQKNGFCSRTLFSQLSHSLQIIIVFYKV